MRHDPLAESSAALPEVNPWSEPFQMAALPHAALAAVNPRVSCEVAPEALLARFAWFVPAPDRAVHAARRTFYADRYGGAGLDRNGGGARCASDGRWQLKGIGLNPLAGVDNAGRTGRPGTATLAECLVEALWSEVFHYALPYGSTRIAAVIASGEAGAPEARPVDRVLGIAVREAAWRPAHFMRAVYFRPAPQHAGMPGDSARVRAAVARIDQYLPLPAALPERPLDAFERLHLGLEEMLRRFAEQMAACNVKRLMHGTITASNICLDGRWIDFSTASALPAYAARVKCLPALLEEFTSLTGPLATLCFYIGKYFAPGTERARLPRSGALVARYTGLYQAAQARRFCAQCGYPEALSARVWSTRDGQIAMRELGRLLAMLGVSGRSLRYGLAAYPDARSPPGEHDLSAIIAALAPQPGRLDGLIADARVREQLLAMNHAVYEGVRANACADGVAAHALARLVRLHRAKAAATHPLFYRDAMNAHVEAMVLAFPDPRQLREQAQALLHETAERARLLYQDPQDYRCLLWCDGADDIHYDARGDHCALRVGGRVWQLPWNGLNDTAALPAAVGALVQAMRAYWGEPLWSA